LTKEQRKNAFEALGKHLLSPDAHLSQLINDAGLSNPWFTSEYTQKAISAIAKMLNKSDLEQWLDIENGSPVLSKKVGLVLAGNIPMVGFHDILSVLATGHIALIKLSSQDQKLIPLVLNKLSEIEPGFNDQIKFVERLEGFDAVIATGSNNSARYFEHYFGKVPHIIRKNRNSAAILSGKETQENLHILGQDIFEYFGLGCRNVSKLYVPENYDFIPFFEAIESYKPVIDHHKYSNNYDYNKSIYLLNRDEHLDNGFLLLKRDERLASPLAVLYFEEYKDLSDLANKITPLQKQIQCVVSDIPIDIVNQKVNFGQSQSPKLWDYADGVNTINFLLSL
jgi:hypothetical protein